MSRRSLRRMLPVVVAALVAGLAVVVVLSCAQSDETRIRRLSDEEQLRQAVVEASRMRRAELKAMLERKGPSLPGWKVGSLTGLVLDRYLRHWLEGVDRWPPDVEFLMKDPDSLLNALSRGEHSSVVWPEDIVALGTYVTGEESALGTVVFEAEGVCRGRVDFSAERRDGRWAITAFRLPAAGVEVRQLGGDLWQGVPRPARASPWFPWVVTVERDRPLVVKGRWLTPEALHRFLRERAKSSPCDTRGFPELGVQIRAYLHVEHGKVRAALSTCASAGMSRIQLYIRHDLFDGRTVHMRIPRAGIEYPGSDGDVREVRVGIVWENGEGQRIWNPSRPYAPDGPRGPPMSTAGAHLVARADDEVCGDMVHLAPKIMELARGEPRARFVIDVAAGVPFRWAFAAAEACRNAGANFRFAAIVAEAHAGKKKED